MKKIQFGCGGNRLEGFENHDSETDITKRLPYDDGVADFVFCEHCIEHVSGAKGFLFMEECHRILKPRGILRLCVPHLDRITDIAHCRDLIVGNGHEMVFNESNLITMLQIAGFDTVTITGRSEYDSHWKVIGEAKDDLETLRVEARKK
jgi:predicted SAM-dependent methyltransferase